MTGGDWIELIWTLVAVGGVGYSVKGLSDALADMDALKVTDHIWEDEVIARMTRRNEAVRLVMLSVFSLVGLGAMAQPEEEPIDLPGFIMAAGLIGAVALFVWGARADRKDRRALLSHEPPREQEDE